MGEGTALPLISQNKEENTDRKLPSSASASTKATSKNEIYNTHDDITQVADIEAEVHNKINSSHLVNVE